VDKLDLLQQLSDVHLPQAPGIWPLAWGFWAILASVLLLMILGYRYRKVYVKWQQKQRFLAELEQLQHDYQAGLDAPKALNELALLLKQVALYYYPREAVASLHGEAWVKFLQDGCTKFDGGQLSDFFTVFLYQENISIDLAPCFVFAKRWIKHQRLLCMN